MFGVIYFLQDCAGRRLYELYWAMKQQMEKGPQDALTLEARYSLSEEKLLRASFDFRELTVFIAADHHSVGAMEYPVRVLDCDSITQVWRNSAVIKSIKSFSLSLTSVVQTFEKMNDRLSNKIRQLLIRKLYCVPFFE